jgi:RND family efflux transporter MFP subunit
MRMTASLGAAGLASVTAVLAALALQPFLWPGEAAPAAAQPAAPATVETVRPVRTDIGRSFNTNGTLEAYETADLYPKVSGYLSEVRVDIGDRVRRGQVLAMVSLPEMEKELAEAEATVAAKRADLGLQQSTLARQEGLLKIQGTSQQAYDEAKSRASVAAAEVDLAAATAEKIRTMLQYARIVAPFDGVVAKRAVNRGDFVQSASNGRSTPLFTVQRVDIIRVFSNVPEAEVTRLRVGMRASIHAFGLDVPITGTVTRFEGRLDPETRNMRTEIDVPNRDGRLYPGMYAQVSLETELHPNALTLPVSAVGADSTGGKFVYTLQQDRIARQPVQTGMTDDGAVEVVRGLAADTTVVRDVKAAPAPGSAVRAVLRR